MVSPPGGAGASVSHLSPSRAVVSPPGGAGASVSHLSPFRITEALLPVGAVGQAETPSPPWLLGWRLFSSHVWQAGNAVSPVLDSVPTLEQGWSLRSGPSYLPATLEQWHRSSVQREMQNKKFLTSA